MFIAHLVTNYPHYFRLAATTTIEKYYVYKKLLKSPVRISTILYDSKKHYLKFISSARNYKNLY